jgi:DNA-binding transcriptional MerR regulator
LRLDLGLLQMEFDGRPDGQRVAKDSESWLEYYQRRQKSHDARYPDGPPFSLDSEDCSRLLREGVQYYHRYISFWRLERYELCARDTSRNLKLFAFVREYAKDPKDKLLFDQYRPYVTMMHARAVATPLISLGDYDAALKVIDAAVAGIRQFLADYDQQQSAENCVELNQLLEWRTELETKQPTKLSMGPEDRLERLRAELETAIREERFEDAARLRDAIRQQFEDPLSPGSPELL